MTSPKKLKPVERSFYNPILDLLKLLGFQGVQEIGIGAENEYMDIFFRYEGREFVVEIKVSDSFDDLIKGILQAYKYAQTHGTKNIIVICYPNSVRAALPVITRLKDRALNTSCRTISLTDVWIDYESMSVKSYFSTLQSYIDREISSIQRIHTASTVLEGSIKNLSNLINREFNDENLLNQISQDLTKDQGLFLSLIGTAKGKRWKNQIVNLLAYILVNQIIFYFLYSRNTENKFDTIEKLRPIERISDLQEYFDQIKQVDFKPIYNIDTVQRIPTNYQIINCVNEIIGCLSPLRLDEIRYDLFGKLIGKSLPEETRDILASYYTKTNSAELMVKLLIDNWDATVWDLACGSGTLLVSSYNRKKELYENLKGDLNKTELQVLHRQFIENQLTGHDFMPFSCHLAGLNLSAQNLNAKTDFMRIENKNSLEIDLSKNPKGTEAYEVISNAIEHVRRRQRTIVDFTDDTTQTEGTSEPNEFRLEKVDAIAINPPFTPYNSIPKELRNEFYRSELTKITGKRVGLWECFLALADQLVKSGGRIGAIIPIALLRGERSKDIRNYYLDNYSIEYIIKPKNGTAFSEDSEYTDIIFICSKTPPEVTQKTTIVLLHKPIDDYAVSDIESVLVNKIKTSFNTEEENEHFSIIKVNQSDLQENSDNLNVFLFGKNLHNIKRINKFYGQYTSSKRLKLIQRKKVQRGAQFHPQGEYKKRVITRASSPSRLARADLYFKGDRSPLTVYSKKSNRTELVDKKKLRKTIRTLTGIKTLDISSSYDYLIASSNDSKARSKVVFSHHIRLNSDQTSVTSVYSEEEILPTDALVMYFAESDEEAKILSLFFSSIFYLVQFKRLEKGTTEGLLEIGEADMEMIFIPNLESIPKEHITELLNFFNQKRNEEFPSITTQLEGRLPERVQIDKLFSKALGINISSNDLFKVYDAILDELSEA